MYLLNFKHSNVFIFLEGFCKIMTKVEKSPVSLCEKMSAALTGRIKWVPCGLRWPVLTKLRNQFSGFYIRIPTGRPINNQTKDDPWRKKVKEDSRPLLLCH